MLGSFMAHPPRSAIEGRPHGAGCIPLHRSDWEKRPAGRHDEKFKKLVAKITGQPGGYGILVIALDPVLGLVSGTGLKKQEFHWIVPDLIAHPGADGRPPLQILESALEEINGRIGGFTAEIASQVRGGTPLSGLGSTAKRPASVVINFPFNISLVVRCTLTGLSVRGSF